MKFLSFGGLYNELLILLHQNLRVCSQKWDHFCSSLNAFCYWTIASFRIFHSGRMTRRSARRTCSNRSKKSHYRFVNQRKVMFTIGWFDSRFEVIKSLSVNTEIKMMKIGGISYTSIHQKFLLEYFLSKEDFPVCMIIDELILELGITTDYQKLGAFPQIRLNWARNSFF